VENYLTSAVLRWMAKTVATDVVQQELTAPYIFIFSRH
jgi:hypothetical protein